MVLAYAECEEVKSDVLQIPLDWGRPDTDQAIDPLRPAIWKRRHEYYLTQESYDFMDRLKRHEAKASGVKISVTGDRWAELTLYELVELDAGQLSEAIEAIRRLPVTGSGQVEESAAPWPPTRTLRPASFSPAPSVSTPMSRLHISWCTFRQARRFRCTSASTSPGTPTASPPPCT